METMERETWVRLVKRLINCVTWSSTLAEVALRCPAINVVRSTLYVCLWCELYSAAYAWINQIRPHDIERDMISRGVSECWDQKYILVDMCHLGIGTREDTSVSSRYVDDKLVSCRYETRCGLDTISSIVCHVISTTRP